MSRGLGHVQNGCLVAIWQYERDGELPTTYTIAAEVYHVAPDEDGNRYVTDAQHVAVKRALAGLQRNGRIIGFRTQSRASWSDDGRTELAHHWMTPERARQWLREKMEEAREITRMGLNPRFSLDQVERLRAKMRALGLDANTSGPSSGKPGDPPVANPSAVNVMQAAGGTRQVPWV
jgi:hypothetical protein